MKIGVSAFAWTRQFEPKHLNLIPRLREHGLDAFELPMFDPSDLAVADVRRAFERSGLECTVCAILPDGINPISPEPSVREKSFAHLVQCVETAAAMGSHLICGPLYAPIGYLPGRRRNQSEWEWAVECFQRLGEALEANQVTLAIEPVNRSETFFLNTGSEAKTLCEAVHHPRIGVTVDTFHANIEEKCIPAAVQFLGPRLKHLHVSENDRGLLGTGHVDFSGVMMALRQIDYDGLLMIEGFGYSPDEPGSLGALWGDLTVTPEDMAFKGARFLQRLIHED
jgi:D-psicose/D-tagatose/L-ribulose 3-epimerase